MSDPTFDQDERPQGGQVIDIADRLKLAAELRQAIPTLEELRDPWLDELDDTSPFTADLFELASLLRRAPATVDRYAVGLLQGVYDARVSRSNGQERDALEAAGIDVERVKARLDNQLAAGAADEFARGYAEGVSGINRDR